MTQEPVERSARGRLIGLLRSGRLPATFVALACATTVWGFLQAADYQVDSVMVRGSAIGDPNEVALASGALGHSIFRIDPAVAAANIAQLPWVERASVRFETPDTLVVELTERTPVAVWSDGASTFLVDDEGQVLFSGDAPGLPHVVVMGAELAPGQAVEVLDVAAVRSITEQLETRLVALVWVDDLGFEATLTDERTIRFGDAERMQLKLAALTAFLPQAPVDWMMLDLSEPERPYFR